MRLTGVVVLLFLLFHLADLTWGWANPDFERGDMYRNVVASFQRAPVAVLYIAANLALGTHLFHGAWSLFRSLGLNHPRWSSAQRAFATAFAGVVTLGNVSFPIAVMAGAVDAEGNPDCRVNGDVIETCELYDGPEPTLDG